jgi:hypothetical protein
MTVWRAEEMEWRVQVSQGLMPQHSGDGDGDGDFYSTAATATILRPPPLSRSR